jgi:hypothetical protein
MQFADQLMAGLRTVWPDHGSGFDEIRAFSFAAPDATP